MTCQRCGSRATQHVTLLAGAVTSEIHLCEGCKGKDLFILPLLPPQARRCDRCGLTLKEIRARGRVGCADDYRVFEDEIAACVEEWHGKSQHVGKHPSTHFFA